MLRTARNLCMVILATALTLSAADATLGTWKVNIAKSKYSPGPGPKSGTLVVSRDGDWIVQKSDVVDSEGKATSRTNRFKLDGMEHPYTTPTGNSATITGKRVDDYHTELLVKGEGKLAVNLHESVSKDGKTRTLTVKGTNANGDKLNHVIVYDKQ